MNPKQKRSLIVVAIIFVLALLAVGIWLVIRSGEGEHKHIPTLIEAKEATCTEDGNNAYYYCDCGMFFTDKTCKNETTEAEQIIPAKGHDAVDDGDCNTPLVCSVCKAVIRESDVHLPEKDDSNCTTAIKCQNCGEIAVEAFSEHNDADHDYVCDNEGCQNSVNPPKDENPGIDLPMDTN